eukprot:944347-Prymnesium_polylepis.1
MAIESADRRQCSCPNHRRSVAAAFGLPASHPYMADLEAGGVNGLDGDADDDDASPGPEPSSYGALQVLYLVLFFWTKPFVALGRELVGRPLETKQLRSPRGQGQLEHVTVLVGPNGAAAGAADGARE